MNKLKSFFSGLIMADDAQTAITKEAALEIEKEFESMTLKDMYQEIYFEIDKVEEDDPEMQEKIGGYGVLMAQYIDYHTNKAKIHRTKDDR